LRPLSILALEPWYGGSHARFLDAWRELSRHDVRVLGLPPRRWKWHMTVGAWALARRLSEERLARCDAILASDFLDLSTLASFLPRDWDGVPRVLYLHESQLTYPTAPTGPGAGPDERDLTFAFRNVLSCLAADAIVFNSSFHAREFARAADELLARMPRPTPRAELAARLQAAQVISPGVDLEGIPLGPGPAPAAPLRVVFNHRWEHDKDPVAFLGAARDALRDGARLELVLLGERFAAEPTGAAALRAELGARVVHAGFAPDRAAYARWLAGSDLVVSTAHHEFFGIAVLEGTAAGCTPLVPARLSYPDLVPSVEREVSLYAEGELAPRLARAARTPQRWRRAERRARMRALALAHDRRRTAAALDALCESLVDARNGVP